jgi:hypothetical protein
MPGVVVTTTLGLPPFGVPPFWAETDKVNAEITGKSISSVLFITVRFFAFPQVLARK